MARFLHRAVRELGLPDHSTVCDKRAGGEQPVSLSQVLPRCSTHHASAPECGPQDASAPEGGPQAPPLLLIGPPASGKSGLLFLAAVLAAEEGAGPVIFLSRDPLQRLPGGGRATRDPLKLKKIRFLYPSSLRELLHLLSTLHLLCPSSSLILLDGVERYLLPTSGTHDGALLSALLLDCASHFNCGLLVSAVPPSEGAEVAFSTMERYFPNQCRLQSEEAMEGSFKVSFLPNPPEWILHMLQDGNLTICPVSPTGQKAVAQTQHTSEACGFP